MSNPTVSVIIPVYNAQEGIKQCLDSLLNQSFTDFEIILLNDGSTDNSLEVIKKYAADNDFIRVIDKENEGVAKTRNKGIQLANGKYIVFIDNDDFVDSDYLERFYNEIDQEQLDIVLGGYKRVNQEMKTLFKQDLTQSEWSKYIVVAPWARIYRTSFLTDNNIQFFDYPIGEDVIFTLTAYNLTERIKIIDYNGYNWFFNEKSISNTSQRGFNPNIDIVYFLSHLLQVAGDSKYIRYFIKRYYIWYLLFSGRAASSSSFMDQYRRIKEWVSKEVGSGKIDAALRAHGAELVVLAGFMRILSGNFVNKWTQKIINIHPALLPSFPGLDAQGQALEYGVKIAGCTVHFVDEGTDSGPIILQKPVPVLNDDTEESLAARILVEEHKAMPEALRLWALGKLEIQGRRVIVHP